MSVSQKNIAKLFVHLWPDMYDVYTHKANCESNLVAINNYFLKGGPDHNKLLKNLCSLDGIGLTIASGLIWSVFPKTRVPFDKYTISYALKLGILVSDNISTNYITCCNKIKTFCDSYENFSIEDFVRKALDEFQNREYPLIEPK